MADLARPIDDGFCVGCGLQSPIGLKMRFETAADRSVCSRVTIPARFQGWRHVVHGGIVALVLDEAMAYAAGAHGYLGVTGELRLRFRKAVPVDEPLVVHGNVRWRRRNVFGIEASVRNIAGDVLATGEASFVSRGKLAPGQVLGEPLGDGRIQS